MLVMRCWEEFIHGVEREKEEEVGVKVEEAGQAANAALEVLSLWLICHAEGDEGAAAIDSSWFDEE
eukprot:576645-Amphidinium_carterae.1